MAELNRRDAVKLAALGAAALGTTASLAAGQDDKPHGNGYGRGTFAGGVTSPDGRQIQRFLTHHEIDRFLKNGQTTLQKGTLKADLGDAPEYRLGTVQTPDGRLIYGSMAMGEGERSGRGAFYTEIGGYQIILSAEDLDKDHHVYKAVLLKDGEPLIQVQWEVQIGHAGLGVINGGGRVESVQVTQDKISKNNDEKEALKNCTIDCLKRHAPDCAWICSTLGMEACVACAGAVGACCLINCHC